MASCLHASQSETGGSGRLIDGLTWMESAALPDLNYSKSFILAVPTVLICPVAAFLPLSGFSFSLATAGLVFGAPMPD